MPRNDAPAVRPTVAGETPLALLRRARRTNRALAVAHPDAHCELDFTTPLELLVATVLSAQTTDVRVNQVTPALFAAYPNAAHYAAADVEDIDIDDDESTEDDAFLEAEEDEDDDVADLIDGDIESDEEG